MPKYERCLFVPDIHAPFQDELALSALLDFSKWFKPDKIFILGDLLDGYAISRFLKDPELELKLQEEIDQAVNILEQIRKQNLKSDIVFIRGNHEYRLQRFLWSEAKALSGLRDLTIESLLHLRYLDIQYEKTGRLVHRGIIIKHGDLVRKFACYSAKAEFDKSGLSGVSGHTHRGGVYYYKNASGSYVWMECGCLRDLHPDYMEGEEANWQQGWGVGYFSLNSPRYLLEFIPFVGGKSFYQGKEFI
jgi:predicted phosphodiesterase